MTRPQDLYADEYNRLVRIAWANPDRYNAAFPNEHIDPTTQSMPVFVADQGFFVDGVKMSGRYPDIPEDYTVPEYPPEWSLPPAEASVEEPYSGPLELDGTRVKIHPTSWPVGYHRQKDVWTIIQEVIYVGAGLFGIPWFLGKSGAQLVAYLIMLYLLLIIPWLEWSSRCEDRVKVQRAAILINAFLAAWAVRLHHEQQQQREARAIRNEDIQRDYEKRSAETAARIAEMNGESEQAAARFRASQDWTR